MSILSLKNLDYLAKIKTKQINKDQIVFNLNTQVEDVISVFQGVVLKKEITITCQYMGFPLNIITDNDSDLDMVQHLNVNDLNMLIKADDKGFR